MAYVSNPGGGGMVRIQQIVCAGLQTTIDFTSIPQTFTDLKIHFLGHDTSTTGADLSARLKVNNDASNFFAANYMLGGNVGAPGCQGGTDAATANGISAMWCPGVSGRALAMSTGEIFIPGYAQTTMPKAMHSTSQQYANGGDFVGLRGWVYLLTNAVTRLTLTCGGTAFANGSIATLYGMG